MSSISSSLNRRQVLWLLGGLTGSLALHSCSAASSSSKLTVGTNPWPGISGQYTAMGKNLFKEEGVEVEETFFQSQTEANTAFLAGKTEVSFATSGDAIEMTHKDPTIRFIYVVDYSDGSDGIIARGIKSPQDLKGKSLARENLLFENVLLRAYLAKGLDDQGCSDWRWRSHFHNQGNQSHCRCFGDAAEDDRDSQGCAVSLPSGA
jgi:NitT/TauT family transport system substrate-binding protein